MASGTLERQTEVIVPKQVPTEAAVEAAARNENRARVSGSGWVAESRAWNSQAQID